MTDITPYLSAFTIGLLGSAHCIGMCGGITSALSLSIKDNSKHSSAMIILGYHLGRIGSYAIAGLILGSLGWFLGDISHSIQIALRWFAGGMLVAMGLYLSGLWKGLTVFERAGGLLWQRIQPLANKLLPIQSFYGAYALGSLWGWLPCGMVYSTLSWSASHANPLSSALLMATFGLGTLPAVLLTGLFAKQLKDIIQAKLTRNLASMMIIAFGLWTLPGPHQKIIMGILSGHS